MRNLSDTIARLRALRPETLPLNGHASGPDRLNDMTDFGANPGALRARFYVPAELPGGAPLVVVLHGCTQSAAAYDAGSGWSQLADQEGFAVLYPEQQRGNNAALCFNWFVPADIRRNTGEALSIRQMVEAMIGEHGLDRDRVYITGLSAGGAMTSVMLATYPEVFAGGAIIAGLPYGTANSVPEALDRMRGHGGPNERQLENLLRSASRHSGKWPKISVWHGSADATVASDNAEAIITQWTAVHGVSRESARTEIVAGETKKTWTNRDGVDVIEAYSIAGMGHGTPLKTMGSDGLGKAGAFMLEASISSTRHIASFWGLSSDGTKKDHQRPLEGDLIPPRKMRPHASATDVPRQPVTTSSVERSSGRESSVKEIIENALRSAGLMR